MRRILIENQYSIPMYMLICSDLYCDFSRNFQYNGKNIRYYKYPLLIYEAKLLFPGENDNQTVEPHPCPPLHLNPICIGINLSKVIIHKLRGGVSLE